MPFEMSCANCEGRLMVETLGIVVACPHCGTHLAIPDEIPGLAFIPAPESEPSDKSTWFPNPAEDPPSSIPDFTGLSGAAGDPAGSESNILISEPEVQIESEVPSAVRVVNPDASAVIPALITEATVSEPISSVPVLGDSKAEPTSQAEEKTEVPDLEPTPEPVVFPEGFPVLEGASAMADSAPNIVTGESASNEATETNPMPAIAVSTEKPVPADAKSAPPPKSEQKPEKKETKKPAPAQQSVYDAVYSSRRGKIIPNPVFQVWLSYTILLTAGLLMAIYYIFTATTRQLESLPDVKPVERSGQVFRDLVPEKAKMPPGHTLALNQTQRFGNIEVTPVRVTKGPLTLEPRAYVGNAAETENVGTVLKLWLKFKNVSEDQVIAPLDDDLLFFRHPRNYRKANNFVCRASEKSEDGNLVFIYEHWTEGDQELKDANIGAELKPGEEVTVYIPTETEGWSELEGPLIWRVHIRKGYSPKNFGVTTIFEVEFDSGTIQSESASA